MSTAVTRCPAAPKMRAVHPAPAIQNTRLPGAKALSSIAESSYVRPNISCGARVRKTGSCQGVATVSTSGVWLIRLPICRGNPRQKQKCEVRKQHARRFGYKPGRKDQTAGIHAHQ